MVKVRAHRLVDGDIITINDLVGKSIDKSVKIVEDDEIIMIVINKNGRID